MYLRRLIRVLLAVFMSSLHVCVTGEPQVPCLFAFGDSLSDCGNNNLMPTLAKSIYFPYGIDFPLGHTGRFTNGRTIVDIFAELLGFEEYPHSSIMASNEQLLKGVNYASGAAGIRDETGSNAGFHFSMNMQLKMHNNTIKRLSEVLGSPLSAHEYLGKCIYSVGFGSNDYMNNYLLPNIYPSSRIYTPDQYAEALIFDYSRQLTALHSSGARKFILLGLGSIGCVPGYAKKMENGQCDEQINNIVQPFNARLILLIDELNKKLHDSKFIYVNISGMSMPHQIEEYGFADWKDSCCTVGISGLCIPLLQPCQFRDKYFYYDAYHPTDAVNVIAGKAAYKALVKTHVYPYDISQLAQQ